MPCVVFVVKFWEVTKCRFTSTFNLVFLFQLVNCNFGSVKPTARAQLVQWYYLVLELSLAVIYSPRTPHHEGTSTRKNQIHIPWSCFVCHIFILIILILYLSYLSAGDRDAYARQQSFSDLITRRSRNLSDLALIFDCGVIPGWCPQWCLIQYASLGGSWKIPGICFFLKLKSHPAVWGPPQPPGCLEYIYVYCVCLPLWVQEKYGAL